MFFEILITMGLLTFLVYAALFVFIYRLLWKLVFRKRVAESTGDNLPYKIQLGRPGAAGISNGADKIIGISLISLITAYIVHNCFIFDTSANFIAFFTVLGFIVFLTSKPTATAMPTVLSSKSQIPPKESSEAEQARYGAGKLPTGQANPKQISNLKSQIPNYKLTTGLQALMLVLLIGVVFLIYKTNVLPAKANYATTRAIIRGWAKDFDGALAKYKEALSYDVPGKYDFRHRFAQYILDYTSGRKIEEKERNALLFAIGEVQKNIKESKQDYLPYLYVSRMFINLGKDDPNSPYNDEALKNSMKALEISPTFVRTYYEIAQAYLNKKDYTNAIKYFSEAVKLNPGVGLSYWYLGAAYLEAGEIQKGLAAIDEAVKSGYALAESDYMRLVNVYFKLGDFAKIVELYKTLIEIKPGNPQYHASLAVAYAKIGKIDEAVSEAKKAAALDKTFEKEARIFVESLGRKY
jgi:tetratricopeptide (TPR) repeat protein